MSDVEAAGDSGGDETRKVELSEAKEYTPVRVCEILPELHPKSKKSGPRIASDAIVPHGYRLERRWISTSTGGRPICKSPVVIQAVLVNESDDSRSIRVLWRDFSGWVAKVIPLEEVLIRSRVERLAKYGLPVSSNTSKDLVGYLRAFYDANQSRLPRCRLTKTLGWQKGGGFLFGDRLIGGAGETVDLDADPTTWPDGAVAFSREDEGLYEVASCFSSSSRASESGQHLNKWKNSVRPMAEKHARVRLSILASMCTPMLELLAKRSVYVPNFVVDFANPTSTGKTTILCCAASVWGYPNEIDDRSPIGTWDMPSPVWAERAAAVRTHLPLILDDSKRAKPGLVSNVIYTIAQGQGRQRGTQDSLRKTGRWRTVLIGSGETRLVDFEEHGGTRARVITVWGAPFGKPNPETSFHIGQMMSGIYTHFGVSGPEFVKWLMANRGESGSWAELYQDMVQVYRERAESNGPLHRICSYLGLLQVTETLAARAGVLPWEPSDVRPCIDELWEGIASATMEADRSMAALEHLRSYSRSRRGVFFSVGKKNSTPQKGWMGRWDSPGKATPEPDAVSFFPSHLKEILEDGGFDYESTIRTWRDKGYLITTGGKGHRQVRCDGVRSRMISIKMSTWEGDLSDDEEQELPDAFDERGREGTEPATSGAEPEEGGTQGTLDF